MSGFARRFTRRFVSLVLMGYFIGLVSVAWAVWWVSGPILDDMSREGARDLLRTESTSIANVLDHFFDTASLLAGEDDVVDFALGYDAGRGAAADLFTTIARDREIRGLYLFDFNADLLLFAPTAGSQAPVAPDWPDILAFVEEMLNAPPDTAEAQIRLNRTQGSNVTRLVLAQPVLSRGLVEAVLVFDITLNLSAHLADGTELVGPTLGRNTDLEAVPAETVFAAHQIGDTGLTLLVTEFTSEAGETGLALVKSVLMALVLVLAVPFLAILVMGYRVLVEPQRKLEKSERELQAQRGELMELASIVRAFRDGILTTDHDQRILWVNSAFIKMTGYSQSEVEGRRLCDFMETPGDNDVANAELELAYALQSSMKAELHYQRKDDTPFWVSASVTPVQNEAGEVSHFAVILSDITTQKAYEIELERTQEETRYRSLHDALTGLPNRRYFDEVLAPLVEQGEGSRCLVRIDLDHFKAVNDSFGHAAGDHVLQVVAELMQVYCDDSDFPARVGGDEFLILLGQGKGDDEANRLCNQLRTEISKDIPFDGSICRIGASFGIANSNLSYVGYKGLLVSADAALYKSKDQGRDTVTLYTPELHSEVLENRRMAKEIEAAIENEEFEPWFQPQFDSVSGLLIGVEALARWRHPERGILEPWRFLSNLDKLGLSNELDSIIYRKGLKQVEDFNKAGLKIPKISFNVSTQQIENPLLGSIADSFDLGGSTVSLEILESVVIEEMSEDKLSNIFSLRERGFRLELDDFGSGHASIAGLLKLRPDIIKIDKVLVQPVVNSTVAQELISSIVDIGRALGVEVTAEGVESREHVEILRGCGVHYLQGFFFSRPLAPEQFAHMLGNDLFPKAKAERWPDGTYGPTPGAAKSGT